MTRAGRGALARRAARLWAWLGGLLVGAALLFAALLLVLRLWALPEIERQRERFAALASTAIGARVDIGELRTGWRGLQPRVELRDLRIVGADGETRLQLPRVEAVASWLTLAVFELRLARLEIEGPDLAIERDASGQLFVAGIRIDTDAEGDSPLADWLLHQSRIVVRQGALTWTDRRRGAPPLRLTGIDFRLDNLGIWHRFALRGTPPAELADPVDLRGSFIGFGSGWQDRWRGDLYLDTGRVDLASWQAWLDYPIELPAGSAGVRAWIDYVDNRPTAATADIVVNGGRMRLGGRLPMLDIETLAGRVRVRQREHGYELGFRDLHAQLADGLRLAPLDADLGWEFRTDGSSSGHLELADLDLGVLARLADYLPLDVTTRRLLADYRPSGRVSDLRGRWQGRSSGLDSYVLRGEFAQIGVEAQGSFPGVQGLTGSVDANEKGGRLFLRSGPSALEFPGIFPEPVMAFDSLAGGVRWRWSDGEPTAATAVAGIAAGDAAGSPTLAAAGRELEVELQALNFAGIDAVGTASGTYRRKPGGGRGQIDLSATLQRAEARAVWRYMPHVVPAGTRDWLRRALVAGVAEDVRLVLSGDLDRFPFAQGGGTFLVTGRVRDGALEYQEGWPGIAALDAGLRFSGSSMTITGRSARVGEVGLRNVKAVLPDMGAADPRLQIDGEASGPLGGLLAFLDGSPVGDAIGGFYRDWNAQGSASLALGLTIPLRDAQATAVRGQVELRDASLAVASFLPRLTNVRGRLLFTRDSVEANDLRGDFLGRPLRVGLRHAEGGTEIDARGRAVAAVAERHYGWPVLGYLGGETGWAARVRVAGGALDVEVDSDLAGVSSSLPDPFNKGASAELPLAVRYRSAADGDSLAIRLGERVAAELAGGLGGRPWQVERGALAIGEKLQVPAQGTLVALRLPEFDADFWRRLLAGAPDDPDAAAESSAAPPFGAWPSLAVNVDKLRFAGRDWHAVDLQGGPAAAPPRGARGAVRSDGRGAQSGAQSGGDLSGRVAARELAGTWTWRGGGSGLFGGRFTHFHWPLAAVPADGARPSARDAVTEGTGATAAATAAVGRHPATASPPGGRPAASPPASLPGETRYAGARLPDIDLTVDDMRVGARRLGRFELVAVNAGDDWVISRALATAPDGDLSFGGTHLALGNRTRLAISLNARDAGSMLDRLGYPGAIARGEVQIGGALEWAGGPTDFDIARLDGDLVLHAERGRFSTVRSDAARLVGLLSLQNLPRRLLLDFGDVVSEGLAFDTVDGRFRIRDGVLATESVRIDGPSARVLMAGSVDMVRETQDLRLAIQPAVGSTVALGAAVLANPIIGVATLLAQKLLRNPLDKAFAVEYTVRGPWAEPQVERVGQLTAGQPGAPNP